MRIIIVGAGYAGVAAALRLARKVKGKTDGQTKITLINSEPVFVERIRLHQIIAGQVPKRRSLAKLLKNTGIELVVGWADTIDLKNQTLLVNGVLHDWDRLVLAMGSHIPSPFANAHALNPDMIAPLKMRLNTLASKGGSRLSIIGGGLTGIEAAAEFAETWPHLAVSLVSSAPLLNDWTPAAKNHTRTRLQRLGIKTVQARVHNVSPDSVETDQGDIFSELAIWTAGFGFPKVPKGLKTNAQGQVLVDPFLRSISHPHIYAAGDLAAPVVDPGDTMPLGCKSALPSGAHVGDMLAREILGQALMPFDYRGVFYCVSLGRRDGLVQMMAADGAFGKTTPKGRVITGRTGAVFKEFVCKGTWLSLVGEARGIGIPMGLRSGHPPETMQKKQLWADNANR